MRIATIGSTRVGGLYEDGGELISELLTRALDAIACDMKDFHVGRFDVRFESKASLRNGTSFVIIEVKGAGSEAVHAWDPRRTLRQAYAVVFEKQRLIFRLGDMMRGRGHMPAGLRALAHHFVRQRWLIRRYPPSN